ncbi:hypothetical protein M8Z33_33540 [Streptomyces sp. ZAF1911]|uniref:hypothetical protein n=1 Tax=Streptomyces sp. ZAF1911 TaxID=2944129 RepID=UPI00237A5AD2|nr:hypothetical protein [Streptomyces sp. ZAF1911]MDD9381488.1 hypothetical protein [Streptomyces sp. ZAF1911]
MGTDLAAMVVDVLTGTATGFGQSAAAEIARMARERLWATPRGQAALAGLDTGAEGSEARGEAEAVLREEIEADPGLRNALSVYVNASANQATGIFLQGAKVRRSQISLGSITIHKPNTTGGLLGLAVALLIVVALVLYGGSQLIKDNAPRSSGGRAPWARELSADEAERVIPGVSDLPGPWETHEMHSVGAGREGRCHSGWSDYDSAAKDADGQSDLSVRFSVRTCPDATAAVRRYTELVAKRDNPGGRKEFPFDTRQLGDESATTSYIVADESLADPAQIGRHLMWRAYVGTVVIVMHYGPLREGAGSEREAEEFMRIVCDRALLAQPRR